MTKKLYCRCSASERLPFVPRPWTLARECGAKATAEVCPSCGFAKWQFPSALAVRNWYKSLVKEWKYVTCGHLF